MGALIAALLEKIFADNVLRFLAYKVLLSFLVFTGLVIVYQLIIGLTLDWLSSLLKEASSGSFVLQVSGVAGWILTKLRIADCMSFFLSALSTKVMLRLLPIKPVR